VGYFDYKEATKGDEGANFEKFIESSRYMKNVSNSMKSPWQIGHLLVLFENNFLVHVSQVEACLHGLKIVFFTFSQQRRHRKSS
jgi:hypothetical protein